MFRYSLLIAGCGLLAYAPLRGPLQYNPLPIPVGVSPILFLGDAVPIAYPITFECGVRNASRYPTFWTLPGAWNHRNMPLFRSEVAKMNEDIRQERPILIYEGIKPRKFERPFRFSDWTDLSDYRLIGRIRGAKIWLRNDQSRSILSRPACRL